MLGLPKRAGGAAGYEGVSPDSWYADEVMAARQAGLLGWAEGAKLNPDAPITRAEMAQATAAAAQYLKSGKLDAVPLTGLNGFIDAAQVAERDKEAFAWCAAHGLMTERSMRRRAGRSLPRAKRRRGPRLRRSCSDC
ncbi:S-layer homology domain-containing protein [Paenibacillus sp. TAB 01]|uniref:S-layer homology domain-containing protein n=1 Tax=Paenibacillus sp. TAB 01 TaxID=3368988 RepID=UPI0037537B24